MNLEADKDCKDCKGTGTSWHVISLDGDVTKDLCMCVHEVE